MNIGFITGHTKDLYRADILAEKHNVGLCIPPYLADRRPHISVKDFMEGKYDYVICGDIGDHTAALALHFEQRNIRVFNGGSIQAYTNENPDYLNTLGHRVGVPIGGVPTGNSKIFLACLMSRKGPCGPAWLLETSTRLGPVRAPGVVVVAGTPINVESRLYVEVVGRIGKIFSSFQANGVAVAEIDVGDEMNILSISLKPPDGFWALWHEAYAGEDVAAVFHGLSRGEKFNYPVRSGQMFAAALLTVPPYPISHLPKLRHLEQGAALENLVKGMVYKDLGKLYCVDAEQQDDLTIGNGSMLGWKVIEEEERDIQLSLQLLDEELYPHYIQVPDYKPGLDFSYTRDYLLTEGWI